MHVKVAEVVCAAANVRQLRLPFPEWLRGQQAGAEGKGGAALAKAHAELVDCLGPPSAKGGFFVHAGLLKEVKRGPQHRTGLVAQRRVPTSFPFLYLISS
jgi:hypothetical protein